MISWKKRKKLASSVVKKRNVEEEQLGRSIVVDGVGNSRLMEKDDPGLALKRLPLLVRERPFSSGQEWSGTRRLRNPECLKDMKDRKVVCSDCSLVVEEESSKIQGAPTLMALKTCDDKKQWRVWMGDFSKHDTACCPA